MSPEPVGRLVRRHRLRADLTLERLAELSGVSDRAISDIERGVARGPQRRTVLALAEGLGLSLADRAAMVQAARTGRRRPAALRVPDDVPHFTGRARELTAIATALCGPGPAVVLLSGPPGFGKTALAVRAAHLLRERFPEQRFVGPGGPGGPGGSSPQPPAGDRALLLLDDAASESQVRAVLPPAGRGAVVVTSRRSLAGLGDVPRIRVGRLPREDARRLLTAITPDGADPGDVTRLAALCDDVPLALRIAGNRLASRPGATVRGLAERLSAPERRLDVLSAGDLGVRAAFDASSALVSPAARELLPRLVLADEPGFGVDLAAALLGAPRWRAADLLDELVDVGLVEPSAGDRYALTGLLRLYAGSRPAAGHGDLVALRAG